MLWHAICYHAIHSSCIYHPDPQWGLHHQQDKRVNAILFVPLSTSDIKDWCRSSRLYAKANQSAMNNAFKLAVEMPVPL